MSLCDDCLSPMVYIPTSSSTQENNNESDFVNTYSYIIFVIMYIIYRKNYLIN